MTGKTDGTNTWTYTWDDDNRLTRVQGPGGVDVQYTYDSQGRMLTRVSGGVTTRFTWDGVKLYQDILSDFASFSGVPPAAVGVEHLDAFRERLATVPGPRGGMYSASSCYRMLTTLTRFFRWAVRQGVVLLDPNRRLRLEKPPLAALRLLTPDQVVAVLLAPDPSTPIGLRD